MHTILIILTTAALYALAILALCRAAARPMPSPPQRPTPEHVRAVVAAVVAREAA